MKTDAELVEELCRLLPEMCAGFPEVTRENLAALVRGVCVVANRETARAARIVCYVDHLHAFILDKT